MAGSRVEKERFVSRISPILVAALVGCGPPGRGPCEAGMPITSGAGGEPNVMVVILDDVGTDKIASYGEHPQPSWAPTLDGLGDEGLRFTNAYVDPTCSPTRATLLTGQRPRRHGIGHFIEPGTDRGLDPDAVTIPEMLRDHAPSRWSTALIGKWHLSDDDDPAGVRAPNAQGFDHFAGTFANPMDEFGTPGKPGNYFSWQRIEDGRVEHRTDYLTRVTTDDAIDALEDLSEPFYLQVAYHAIHEPWHVPPQEMLRTTIPPNPTEFDMIDLMLEAMDLEIRRLLEQVDLETTTVIVLSDNGTKLPGIRPPWVVRGSKATLYESGTRVPMWALGAGVEARGETGAMVYAADLFATVADLAGVDVDRLDQTLDGVSLVPLLTEPDQPWRKCMITEKFPVNGRPGKRLTRAVRDDAHKLLENRNGALEVFDLTREEVDRGPDYGERDPSSKWGRIQADLAAILDEEGHQIR